MPQRFPAKAGASDRAYPLLPLIAEKFSKKP